MKLILLFLIGIIFSTNIDGTEYNIINIDGTERKYLLYYPTNLRSSKINELSVPLFVILHGGSVTSTHFLHLTDFHLVSENKGFIAIFPEGHCDIENVMCCWNSGHIRGLFQEDWEKNDIKFLDELITEIINTEIVNGVRIDSNKIVMTGFSSGGFMTYSYAINTTEHQLYGIIPISSTIGGLSAFYQQPQLYYDPNNWGTNFKTNVLHIHGLIDNNVYIDGGDSYGRDDMSMMDSIDFWIKENECQNLNYINTETDLNGRFVLTRYADCGENKIYTLVGNEVIHDWINFDEELQNYPKNNFAKNSRTLSELVYNLYNYLFMEIPIPDTDPDSEIPTDGCEPLWPFYDCSSSYVNNLSFVIILSYILIFIF